MSALRKSRDLHAWLALEKGRRLETVLVLATVLVYAVLCCGIPLPMGVVSTSDTPFPCQGHQCGCRSAEQCWRACCCQTLAERLDWARQMGVTPPSYVLANAELLVQAEGEQAPSAELPACCRLRTDCRAHPETSCSEGQPLASQAIAEKQAAPRHAKFTTHSRSRGITLLEAQRCQGGSTDWTGVPWSTFPVRPCALSLDPVAEPLCTARPLYPLSPSYNPLDPPPRRG